MKVMSVDPVAPNIRLSKKFFLFLYLFVFLFLFCAVAAHAADLPYRVVRTIATGGEGGWDYLTVDASARRLYVSRGTRVLVLNADSGAPEGEIPNTEGVHGIALAPDLGRGFTSNGRANTVTIFDPKTLATLGTVKVPGENPDAILYDPLSHRVFTFNGRTANVTAIEGATGAVAGTFAVGGKPEFAVTDLAGRVYVNIEDKNEIVAFDSRTLKVEAHWTLAGCDSPTGLAIDVKAKRLFAGCGNQVLLVLSTGDGRAVAKLPIGKGTDAVVFDPDANLVFSSNGDGTLTVIHGDSPDAFRVVQNLATKEGARTMALDPKTHAIFLPTARFGPPPPATPENPRPRRQIVAGSFEILVATPAAK
jgi:DNA-binding beta-propeller fold protein YncE